MVEEGPGWAWDGWAITSVMVWFGGGSWVCTEYEESRWSGWVVVGSRSNADAFWLTLLRNTKARSFALAPNVANHMSLGGWGRLNAAHLNCLIMYDSQQEKEK